MEGRAIRVPPDLLVSRLREYLLHAADHPACQAHLDAVGVRGRICKDIRTVPSVSLPER
jgi:hypothetical protein